ncbi:MFS transporter [Bifidobacterium callitrichos]|uniref:MFS transporter n=1 Tax=Bifidobacterium callitrichos TaxID=762209 RepID=A0A5M9ZB03_9BIFI|nr:sugar porter family MFS transporter [Bifidobacterium callitrichos]KAA8815785.1 MFS transporter [Bifidobacterium callitrichos]
MASFNDIAKTMDVERLAAKRRRYSTLMVFLGICGGGMYGYVTVVLSGALISMTFDGAHTLSSLEQGIATAGLLLGAAVGSLLGGSLADNLGRKKVILVGGVIVLLGCLGCALAPNYAVFVVSRVVLGLGAGFTSCVVPMAIGELAPAAKRGTLVSVNSVMINIAQLLATVVNAAIAVAAPGNWRLMLWASIVPVILLIAITLVICDTPNYFMRHGMDTEAVRVLLATRDREEAEGTYADTVASLRGASEGDANAKKEGFSSPWLRRVLIVGIGLAVMQQFSGINAINFFAPKIFVDTLGFDATNSILLAVPVMLVSAVAAIFGGLFLIDRVDRRPNLLVGTAGMVVFLFVIAVCYHLISRYPEGEAPKSLAWLLIAMMMVYLLFVQGSVCQVTWLLIAEVFPSSVRGAGMAFSIIAMNASALILTVAFPPLLDVLGGTGVFVLFGVIGIISFIFVERMVPETRGKTLAQIEQEARERAS